MARRKKTGLLGQIVKGIVKGVMMEPNKYHRNAKRKARQQRRKWM